VAAGRAGAVDVLLDDPAFFAPFAPHSDLLIGRPSTPVECYLRLMFLKFRYRLGFESLCAEVSDPITWRRSCRITLDAKTPPAHRRASQPTHTDHPPSAAPGSDSLPCQEEQAATRVPPRASWPRSVTRCRSAVMGSAVAG
jgi:Transposase domain (DUF772)